jgi:hypothetical protein
MIINSHILHYLKVDLERAFFSSKFIIGVVGIVAIWVWGSMSSVGGIKDNTIIFLLWWGAFNIRYVFVMLFCAIPYAGSFCEDMEYGYIRQAVIRGNLIAYCVSKVIAITVSAVGAMVVGTECFVLTSSMFTPWMEENNSVYIAAVRHGSFHNVLANGHYLAYSCLFALQFGLLTAVLALTSACVSLFVNNKLLVWSIPLIAYYLISQYSWTAFAGNSLADLNVIFSGRYNIFNNDSLSFLYALGVAMVAILLLTAVIYRRLKRRINGD